MFRLPAIRLVFAASVVGWFVPAAHAFGHRGQQARRAVLQMEEQWRQAQLADDADAMDRMLADDYLGVSAFGVTSTKQQTLRRAATHQVTFHHLDVTDERIRLNGAIAVVDSIAHVDAVNDGRVLKGDFRLTRVYQRLGTGTWKITSFEATPMRGTSR